MKADCTRSVEALSESAAAAPARGLRVWACRQTGERDQKEGDGQKRPGSWGHEDLLVPLTLFQAWPRCRPPP
jgi:hypothetical protein